MPTDTDDEDGESYLYTQSNLRSRATGLGGTRDRAHPVHQNYGTAAAGAGGGGGSQQTLPHGDGSPQHREAADGADKQGWLGWTRAGSLPSGLPFGAEAATGGPRGCCAALQRITYKHVGLALTLVCVVLVVITTVGFVSQYYASPCTVYLADFTVMSSPGQAERIPIMVTLALHNPSRPDGQLNHASFRVTFTDYINGGATYEATNQLQFPATSTECPEGGTEVTLPSGDLKTVHLLTNLTMGDTYDKVSTLVYSMGGCFGVTIQGEVKYHVGLLSVSKPLQQTFQLFEHGACPCSHPG